MLRHWVFTLGLLLVSLAATAFAVRCYECDSFNDVNCGDDFLPDDIAKTDCDAMELPENLRAIYIQRPDTACLTKYYKGLDDALFVRRSCAFGDLTSCDEQPDSVMPDHGFLGCVFCHKDFCNGSARSALAQYMLLGIIVISTYFLIN